MSLRLQHAFACVLLASCGCVCSEQTVQSPVGGRPELPTATAAEPLVGLPEPMVRGEPFRRGVALGPLTEPASERDQDVFKRACARQLDEAVALGATDVELSIHWRQAGVSAVEVFPYDSIHDDLLSWLVDQAERRKLRVLLAPVLAIEQGAALLSARELAPSSWERWWWSYQRFALHYARVAAMRKIPLLSVGSELTSAEPQAERFRKLIQDIRKIYKGQLTYLASSESFDKVTFWDALDVAGLTLQQQPRSESQLLERLAPVRERLASSKAARELGYLVTEAGCGAGESDPARSLLCERALYQTFRDDAQLSGIYLRPMDAAKGSGRSASEVVRHWYRKSRG